MQKNYWTSDINITYPKLQEDINADIVIIGCGLAGVLCAEQLVERGFDVCILEADVVCGGDSARSTAMVTYAHDAIYDRLIAKHGKQVAAIYLQMQKDGLTSIKNIVKKYELDCELTECDFYLFATTPNGAEQIKREYLAYEKLGEYVEQTTRTELPFVVQRALRVKNQCRLNPLKFVTQLAKKLSEKGVRIFENTKVVNQPKDGVVTVGNHTVKAKKFIVCTHYPYINMAGFYFAKIYQSRSYNIVFNSNLKINNMYESVEDNGFEYRQTADNQILCGGANIRTGKYNHNSQYRLVEKNIHEQFDVTAKDIVSRFSAQDCMTFDMLPFVGQYGRMTKGLYVVSGFNKWGFTNAACASEIISDLIDNKRFGKNIFDPQRIYMLKTPLKTVKNTIALLGGFGNRILNLDCKKTKNIRAGQGAVVVCKGKRIGIYVTPDGQIKQVHAVCPHMGCYLAWNKDELTWDCPCHGSRFDVDGNLINNPATHNADIILPEN